MIVVAASFGLWATFPFAGLSAPTSAELSRKIDRKQAQVEAGERRERVLTKDVAAYTARLSKLQRRLDSLNLRQGTLQANLDARRTELARTRSTLRSTRARLTRLRARLAEVRRVLERRLVADYKSGRQDVASVLVTADGFEQLVESGEQLARLAEQDQRILRVVSSAKSEARAAEVRLDKLERRQQALTAGLTRRRDEVARTRRAAASVAASARRTRAAKGALLAGAKERRADLEEDLVAMRAQQARISSALTSPGASPVRRGTGQLIYPIDGTFTSSFGMRWGRLHAGIDVAIPIGTPLRAADGGRVALAGPVSGYGNYTCIQHSAAMSTCYAHQDSIAVRVGQSVTQGQVIGRTGNTGRSTGPHLHFEVRINGTPVDPMRYL